jgi:glycosyltransferase involved in cell wall biosynthesis
LKRRFFLFRTFDSVRCAAEFKPMNRKSVSVVIPAYNAARTIGRAIDSVLAQTVRPDEILVVDDGSSDHLESSLEPYGAMVSLVRQPNGGAASARNLGIDRSHGEFLALLDADDYWQPAKLERQIGIFHKYPELGLVATCFSTREPGSSLTNLPLVDHGLVDRLLAPSGMDLFRTTTRVLTSTVVIRREALGDLRFVSGLEPAEDRDLWIRLVYTHPVYIIGDSLVTVVLESGSLSRTDPDQGYPPMIEVLRLHSVLLTPRELKELEAGVFRHWASSHLGNGQPRSALNPALRRLARQPASPEAWWVVLKSARLAVVRSVFHHLGKSRPRSCP